MIPSGLRIPSLLLVPLAAGVLLLSPHRSRSGADGASPEAVQTEEPRGAERESANQGWRPEADIDRTQDLRDRLAGILPVHRWRRGEWAVLVVSLDRGDTLFSFNAHQPMTPASNVKLLTTASALHHLGPDFRYRTFLLSEGEIVDGVLHGDLILYGTGDPALSDRFHSSKTEVFERLTAPLEEMGIRKITGDIVGDGSYFSGPGLYPGWDRRDLNEWFAAPVSALSYNENMITLLIRPHARPGFPPLIHTLPEGADIPVLNEARSVNYRPGRHKGMAVLRASPTEPIRVVGEAYHRARPTWRQLTVSDPPRFAASILRRVLEERGIDVDGGVRTVSQGDPSKITGRNLWAPALWRGALPRVLASHMSPPLSELLKVVNRRSHNLYAEMILRTIGRVAIGDGSFLGGIIATRRFLVAEAGIPPAEVRQVDGSGLAFENRVTPFAFVRLLDHMARTPHWEAFAATLPEAGDAQGLPRMHRSAASGNLQAKTGTMEAVSALSGIVRTAHGERILFSIVSNDVTSTGAAKRVEDRIGVSLAAFDRSFTPRLD